MKNTIAFIAGMFTTLLFIVLFGPHEEVFVTASDFNHAYNKLDEDIGALYNITDRLTG